MNEHEIRTLRGDVRAGRVSRRHLRTLSWDAPNLLNPQIAVGLKD